MRTYAAMGALALILFAAPGEAFHGYASSMNAQLESRKRYFKGAGIGTIVSMMFPYSIAFLVLWTLFLILCSGWLDYRLESKQAMFIHKIDFISSDFEFVIDYLLLSG